MHFFPSSIQSRLFDPVSVAPRRLFYCSLSARLMRVVRIWMPSSLVVFSSFLCRSFFDCVCVFRFYDRRPSDAFSSVRHAGGCASECKMRFGWPFCGHCIMCHRLSNRIVKLLFSGCVSVWVIFGCASICVDVCSFLFTARLWLNVELLFFWIVCIV